MNINWPFLFLNELSYITFNWHQCGNCYTLILLQWGQVYSSLFSVEHCDLQWATCLWTTSVDSFKVFVIKLSLLLHDKLGYGMYRIGLLIVILLNIVYVLLMEWNKKCPHNQNQFRWSILIKTSGLKTYNLLVQVKCLGSFVNSSILENIILLVTFISSS